VKGTLTSTVPFDAALLKVVLDRVGRVSPSLDTAAARKLDFEFFLYTNPLGLYELIVSTTSTRS
jgi:hypothetical protein